MAKNKSDMSFTQLAALITASSVKEIEQMDDDVMAQAIKQNVFDVKDLRSLIVADFLVCKAISIKDNGIKVSGTSLAWPQEELNRAALKIQQGCDMSKPSVTTDLKRRTEQIDRAMTRQMLRFFRGNSSKAKAMYIRLHEYISQHHDVQMEAGDTLIEWTKAIDSERAAKTEQWDRSAANLVSR